MSIFESVVKNIEEIQQTLASEALCEKNLQIFERSFLYIQSQIKNADDLICAASIPQEIANALGTALQELNAYVSSRNDANFNNACKNIVNAVKSTAAIPQIPFETKGEYIAAALTLSDAKIKSIETKLANLNTNLATLQSQSDNLIQSLTDNFNKLIDGTPEEAGFKSKLTEALAKIENQFHKELFGDGEDKKGWVASANEVHEQLNSILLDGKNLGRIIGVDDLTKEQRQQEQVSLMQRVKNLCEELLNKIGLGASVGGYQRRANVELISGSIWTITLVLIFCGLIWFNLDALKFLQENLGTEKVYPYLLFRFIAAIPFVAFMTFAGFKAKHHRAMELKYRQFELELAAFEPNLASLPQDVRGFAKLMFIQKTFGNFEASTVDQSVSLDDLKKLLSTTKESIDGVEELIKKFPK